MFTCKNIAKHAKETPAGTVHITRTAPCEGDETCASSFFFFFVFFHPYEGKKNPSALISLLKADFGREITWHCIFMLLLENTRPLNNHGFFLPNYFASDGSS